MSRECNKCVYSTRDGFCRKFTCEGTKTVEDIKAEAIEEVFKGIYEHFEEHHIEVFGKDEVLDELILFLDEYYVYTKIKEKLKENENG